MATSLTEDRLDLVFKALASHPRRQILAALAAGTGEDVCCAGEEVCACDLTEVTGLGAPTVSHHMKTLVGAGLVTAEKRGLWVYYRLRPETFVAAVGEIREFFSDAQLDAACACAPVARP